MEEDAVVQGTADEALHSKQCCVRLGYYDDRFVHMLASNKQTPRYPPLINRGYWSRVSAVRLIINDFVSSCFSVGFGCQIVSLGGGYDTNFFWLKDSGSAPDLYVEVDFPVVCQRKEKMVSSHAELSEIVGTYTQNIDSGVFLKSPSYSVVSADLRVISDVEKALLNAGVDFKVPTLFLSECVLVYLRASESNALIEYVGTRFTSSAVFCIYEPIGPDDPFGHNMVENLRKRGCPLYGLSEHPDLASQESRFLSRKWDVAKARNMNQVYNEFVDQIDRKRIERLELFDEFEEWNLIQDHYCVVVAAKTEEPCLKELSFFPH